MAWHRKKRNWDRNYYRSDGRKYLDLVCEVADILQIGSRNMQNYPLITAAAKTKKPIMIKRHYGASLRDWLGAAEYALYEGNTKIILCERV